MNRLMLGTAAIWAMMCIGPTIAGAAVVKNISTGINATTGVQIANNASDTNYIIAAGGTGGFIGQNPIARITPLPSTYMADSVSTGSRWIAMNSGAGLEGISVPVGSFEFQTTVDLTGFDPATATIPAAQFGVDDSLDSVTINGITAFTATAGFQEGFDKFYQLPANLGTGDFVAGLNTITFQVTNEVPGTPEAFRLEGTVTATPLVPEPATIAILALPLALLLRRRCTSGTTLR